MRKKLFILLAFLILCAAPGCISLTPTECKRENLTPNTTYIISYDHPPTSRQDILRTTDQNGTLFFPKDANGNCNAVTITSTLAGFNSFAVSPSSIDLEAPPATMSVTGTGISSTYGMPVVDFYDNNSNFIARTTATAVDPGGTWLQATTPDLSQVYSGNYQVEVHNVKADSSMDFIGIAEVVTYGRDEPQGCNPTQQEVQDCINCCGVNGSYWNYEWCTCIPG
jgi:hypothetical protein